MKATIISRVMDMTTGKTRGTYPTEYCYEWSKWRGDGGDKSKRLLELEERYQVKRYKVTYELIEDDE